MAKLQVNQNTGLVPIVPLVSEAGLGLRKGEVRGVSIECAELMIKKGTAKPYSEKAQVAAAAEAAEDAEKGNKGLEGGIGAALPGFTK